MKPRFSPKSLSKTHVIGAAFSHLNSEEALVAHAYIMSHHLVTVREMALETKISEGRVRRLLRGLVGGYVPKFAREFYEKIHNGFEGASFRYSYSVRLYQEEVRRLEFVPVYEI